MNNGKFETPQNSVFSESDIAEMNRRHDDKYGWKPGMADYSKKFPMHRLFGPPHLDKRLPDRELDQMVWRHHLSVTLHE